MAKRKITIPEPRPNALKAAVAKIISKVNLNSIFLATLTVVGSFITIKFNDKTNKVVDSQQAAYVSDTSWKQSNRIFRQAVLLNFDTIKKQNKLILKKLK